MNKQNNSFLHVKDLPSCPISLFSHWFTEAQNEIDRSAMTLATVNIQYQVSARMVLLKSFDKMGFTFYTNYLSPKANDLKEIPHAALVFWWPLCARQVRITGTVSLGDPKISDRYFASRSKGSKIAAIVSKQSEKIPNREDLLERYEALAKTYENTQTISRPDYWGGYLLSPQTIEFWQSREHRLHDRFLYQKQENIWNINQLSP